MTSSSYTEFVASHRAAPDPSCKRRGDVPADERIEVSVYLKPRDTAATTATTATASDSTASDSTASDSTTSGNTVTGTEAAAAVAGGDLRAELQARRAAQHAGDIALVR